jgi:hypothetical protein
MKKLMSLILVLSAVEGLVARAAAGAEAGMWYPTNGNCASDNILLTASAVTVFEIQDDAGPAYILCLENAAQPSDKMTDGVKYTTITSLLPEPTTIAVLGLAGLLFHRPRIVRSVA